MTQSIQQVEHAGMRESIFNQAHRGRLLSRFTVTEEQKEAVDALKEDPATLVQEVGEIPIPEAFYRSKSCMQHSATKSTERKNTIING